MSMVNDDTSKEIIKEHFSRSELIQYQTSIFYMMEAPEMVANNIWMLVIPQLKILAITKKKNGEKNSKLKSFIERKRVKHIKTSIYTKKQQFQPQSKYKMHADTNLEVITNT